MQEKTFDSKRQDFAPYGFTCEVWKPMRFYRPDRHNEIELNLLTGGFLVYRLGAKIIKVDAGSLVAFWASTPHQIIDIQDDHSYYVATIPLAWFLQWKLPQSFVQAILNGSIIHETDTTINKLDRIVFDQWANDFTKQTEERLHIVQLELEARMRRLALSWSGTSQNGPDSLLLGYGTGAMNKIEQMALFIANHYTEPLQLKDIGKAVDLHPNYAATLFHKAFGMTLNNYIIDYRISHAQRLLVTTDQKVLPIALNAGFNSLSRFNAAFRKTCGCTPREYRKSGIAHK